MTGKKSSIESVLGPFQVLCKFLKVMERYVDGEIDMSRARELLGLDPTRLSEPRITGWRELMSMEPQFELSDDQGVHPWNFHESVEDLSKVEMIQLMLKWGWIGDDRAEELMGMLREERIRTLSSEVTEVDPKDFTEGEKQVDPDLKSFQDFYSRVIAEVRD